MSSEEISIKDIYGQLSEMKGQMTAIVNIIPKIGENENNIIRLQASDAYLKDSVKSMTEQLKEDQSRNQKILISIGVLAILAGAFGDLFVNKLLA